MTSRTAKIVLIILSILYANNLAISRYVVVEHKVIPWGNHRGQLPVNFPYIDDNFGEYSDSDIQIPVPEHIFIDLKDNIYFGSTADSYIKGFDKTGKEIMFIPSGSRLVKLRSRLAASMPQAQEALSAGNPYNEIKTASDLDKYSYKDLRVGDHYELGYLHNFYVDSLSRIYIEGMYDALSPEPGFDQDYIAIVNYDGKLVGKLEPADYGIRNPISMMTLNSKNVLTFVNFENDEHYTYRDGKLLKGGLDGWLAGNHYYYNRVYFQQFPNGMKMVFDLQGDPTFQSYADSISRGISSDIGVKGPRAYTLESLECRVLGVSDNLTSFVLLDDDQRHTKPDTVMVLNSKYELIDQIVITKHTLHRFCFNQLNAFFVRPDACLFYLYCDDDGVHIEKWQNR